jgi:hypothetical protein
MGAAKSPGPLDRGANRGIVDELVIDAVDAAGDGDQGQPADGTALLPAGINQVEMRLRARQWKLLRDGRLPIDAE